MSLSVSSPSDNMPVNSSLTVAINVYDCLDLSEVLLISVAYTFTKVLPAFPLCTFVLYLGHRRGASGRSDHFTVQLHDMAAMELLSEAGWALLCCGSFTHLRLLTVVGLNVFFIVFSGQTLFHVLICLERYLAVVHPIAYRGLQRAAGVRIRSVWLFCVGWGGLSASCYPDRPILAFLIFLTLCLLVVTFCSVSVLCVLIRPGPGDVAKDRERVDQVKQKAFYTIMSIMAVLWLLFMGLLVCFGLTAAPLLNIRAGCVAMISAVWFKLPSSLVSPLFFLHRHRTLTCCCSTAKD